MFSLFLQHMQLQKVVEPMDRVKHITAFIEEQKLIDGLLRIIFFFLLVSLVFLSVIMLRRTHKLRIAKKVAALRDKYATLIAELMSVYTENDKVFQPLTMSVFLDKKDRKRSFNRRILLDQMVLMKKHVSGEEALSIYKLYKSLGFERASFRKLKSWFWTRRLAGLQELVLMETSGTVGTFQKLTSDKNMNVRIAAFRALILRGGDDWQQALVRYGYPLSNWEQFQICDALSKRQQIQLPDFTPLLRSLNPSVLTFAMRMIKHFHSLEAVPAVRHFLEHENPEIAAAALEVMLLFGFDPKETHWALIEEHFFNHTT
jgi:hypothetical protein